MLNRVVEYITYLQQFPISLERVEEAIGEDGVTVARCQHPLVVIIVGDNAFVTQYTRRLTRCPIEVATLARQLACVYGTFER